MISKAFWLLVFPLAVAVILFYLLQNMGIIPNSKPVKLETPLGKLLGARGLSRAGRPYNSFTRIPYAVPPLGVLRFSAPVKPMKWIGVLDATRLAPDCMQIETIFKFRRGQEDCLYLNVHTPVVTSAKLLPVIAYIHGGHFMFGGVSLLGPQYFMDEDVVLVTMNYRLGALGFLNTGDEVVLGNMGLRDQTLALDWIRENIEYFGGNKDFVTLAGTSAGASSVHLHMLSKMSRGKFRSAISQSGSSLSPWGFTRAPKEQAIRLGKQLDCPTNTSTDLVQCLRRKKAEEIIEIHRETLDIFHAPEAIFAPSIEVRVSGKPGFLTQSPHKLLKEGKFVKVPWITGVTSEEGCYRVPALLNSPKKLSHMNTFWNSATQNALLLYNDGPLVSNKIRTFYFGDPSAGIGIRTLKNLTDVFSDRYFVSGVREAAIFHSKEAPTFLYYFTNKGAFSFGPILKASALEGTFSILIEVVTNIFRQMIFDLFGWDYEDYGVCHGDDLFELFQLLPFKRIPSSSRHYSFSRSLVKLWARFSSQNLTERYPNLQFDGVTWEPLKPNSSPRYFNFGGTNHTGMINEPFTQRMQFWKSLNLSEN